MIFSEDGNYTDNPDPVRCYGILGCFPITDPWNSRERAYNVFPFSPTVIATKFPLFTNKTRESPTLIDLDDPATIASIGRNQKIFVIAHGFLELGNSPWMVNMTNELLDNDNDAAVIHVDWRGGASPPYYQAIANIRVVGAVLANLIAEIFLELEMENLDNFHLIGHSLGAHLCGYAGYYLQRDFNLKVGRITGLDPAKPYFEFTNPIVRLDPTDAKFVDVVHTDAGSFAKYSFGLKQPVGHIDFYPNGGEIQPACVNSTFDITCHHKNAFSLFTESINTRCPFTAISCSGFQEFSDGGCDCENAKCFTFGFRSIESYRKIFNVTQESSYEFAKTDTKPRVAAFLTTGAHKPFCQAYSKVSIKIAKREDNLQELGTLKMRIIGSETQSEIIELSKKTQAFNPSSTYNYFVSHSDFGSNITKLKIQYDYDNSFFNIFTVKLYVEFVEIHLISGGKRYKMCPEAEKPLVSGEAASFTKAFCGDDFENVVIN